MPFVRPFPLPPSLHMCMPSHPQALHCLHAVFCSCSLAQVKLMAGHAGGVLEDSYLVKSALVCSPAYAVMAGWPLNYLQACPYFLGQVEVSWKHGAGLRAFTCSRRV